MRVLLVEPDDAAAAALELMLAGEGMAVVRVEDVDEAFDFLKVYPFDIIITELLMQVEGGDRQEGLDLIRLLRHEQNHIPVLVLSRLASIDDKVRAFGFGADEYMVKPYHRDELVARLYAVVRRDRGHAQLEIEVGNLVIQLGGHAKVAGMKVHLTGNQFKVLEVLAINLGRSMRREALFGQVYGDRDGPEIRVLDAYICRVRSSLRAAGWTGGLIRTIHGEGWALEVTLQ